MRRVTTFVSRCGFESRPAIEAAAETFVGCSLAVLRVDLVHVFFPVPSVMSISRERIVPAAPPAMPWIVHGKLEVRRNLEKSERALVQDRASPRMMHNSRKGYVKSDKMKYVQIRALELGQNKFRGAGFEPPANLCKT